MSVKFNKLKAQGVNETLNDRRVIRTFIRYLSRFFNGDFKIYIRFFGLKKN